MNEWVLAAVALITYGSRALALVFLPAPSGQFEAVLGRMPAPIFASLATLTLITDKGQLTTGPVVLAALGALILAPRRSLALCLVAGFAGYLLGKLVLPGA